MTNKIKKINITFYSMKMFLKTTEKVQLFIRQLQKEGQVRLSVQLIFIFTETKRVHSDKHLWTELNMGLQGIPQKKKKKKKLGRTRSEKQNSRPSSTKPVFQSSSVTVEIMYLEKNA